MASQGSTAECKWPSGDLDALARGNGLSEAGVPHAQAHLCLAVTLQGSTILSCKALDAAASLTHPASLLAL